ncbi:hypothetical protein [Desulforhabdus amnigena]|nr:hypothetical protein [Desulforhabdus amnigena]NLJ27685.1 hypothetical protein [Deltaproteobacteria bacterium]
MKKIRSMIQHWGNALHLYCRLRPLLGKRVARAISIAWEHCILYRVIYS